MSDDATFILFMLFWATVAYAAYLRIFVVRRLRKKLDKIVDGAVARQPIVASLPSAPTAAEESELKRIKDRLHVLERITVEKENSLSQQIDELRATGA